MQIKLRSWFSPLADTNPDDARDLASALARLGYHAPDPHLGVVPFDPDKKFFDELRAFQTDHGLFPGASLHPGDDTEVAINSALTELVKSGNYFVWRTAKDSKVRPAHAAREGHVYNWSENIPGGAPGDDYNCRCWAEPYLRPYAPPPVPSKKPKQIIKELQYEDAVNPVGFAETVGIIALALSTIPEEITAITLLTAKKILSKAPRLNQAQAENLARFIKKAPKNSKNNIEVVRTLSGKIKFRATSPSRTQGYKSVYEKTVDSKGNTIGYNRKTYDPDGKVIHDKNKFFERDTND